MLFIGTYIPLHGADTIVRAAHLLERAGEAVEVVLVGGGQTYAGVRTLASRLGVTNVRFEPRIPIDRLAGEIARSDVCLGIFGDSPKAGRVIPNKVFDALAMGRPVVTRDSAAAREALTHGHTAWLVPPADPEGLAAAIAGLKADDEARARIARQGHQLFRSRFSIDALSATLAGIVRELVPWPRSLRPTVGLGGEAHDLVGPVVERVVGLHPASAGGRPGPPVPRPGCGPGPPSVRQGRPHRPRRR